MEMDRRSFIKSSTASAISLGVGVFAVQ
ncbi:MAG: twin-arginine translocation signal domain-containing protein [Betaproteobacteria bacterium]|nr:twin-arginine translocation signal domain-containing protein [Betaproteobacteria bacterium]